MMFLLEKDGKQEVVSQTSLDWEIEKGWKIVKPLPKFPSSAKARPITERTPEKIIKWYDTKISILEHQLKHYKEEYTIIKKYFNTKNEKKS